MCTYIINPQCACAARVTVVVLCVFVCPLIPAASHIGIAKERYQRIQRNTGIVLNFADFPKNASFKSYGVICDPLRENQPYAKKKIFFFRDFAFFIPDL